MIVGILADTHHNTKNYSQALEYLESEDVSILIHCGDWDRLDDVRAIAAGFSGEIYGVLGNIDTEAAAMVSLTGEFPRLDLVEDTHVVEVDGRTIAVNHFPEKAEAFARTGNYDAVFHGHTHQSRTEQRGTTLLANPGTLAGRFHEASFGLYNTSSNHLEILSLASVGSS